MATAAGMRGVSSTMGRAAVAAAAVVSSAIDVDVALDSSDMRRAEAEEDTPTEPEGANAAAEPLRAARMVSFIIVLVCV